MKVLSLLTNAIYKSISDRELEPAIEGPKVDVALELFNDIVSAERNLLPFVEYSEYADLAALQAAKFWDISRMDYVIDGIKFPMVGKSYAEYDRDSGVIGLTTIPNMFWLDDSTNTVSVYPSPGVSGNKFLVWGVIASTEMLKNDVLPTNMPRAIRQYFTYELACMLADEYNMPWPPQKEKNQEKWRIAVENLNNEDLSPVNDVMFTPKSGKGAMVFPYWFYASGGGQ